MGTDGDGDGQEDDADDVTVANVALRYVVQQRHVSAAIVGVRLGEREHIEDNQRVFRFRLTQSERAHIEAVLAKGNARPHPGGSGPRAGDCVGLGRGFHYCTPVTTPNIYY